MLRFVRHFLTYVVVCAFLVVIWFLTKGTPETLTDLSADPAATAVSVDFWPIWPILVWGLIVVLDLVRTITGGGRRRRKKKKRHMRERLADKLELIPEHQSLNVGDDTTAVPTMRHRSPVDELKLRVGQDVAGTISGARKLIENKLQEQIDGLPGGASQAGSGGPTRRAVTVVFTDVVGSTSLAETLGDDAYATMLRQHRVLVRDIVASKNGDEVGTQGDGFLLAFDVAFDAVRAACAINHALAGERSDGRFAPQLRIGIHAGAAIDEGDDLVGAVLNTAARICSAADANEILMSEAVAETVGGRVTLVDRGLVSLKGVGQPRHLFAVDWDDSGFDATSRLSDEVS